MDNWRYGFELSYPLAEDVRLEVREGAREGLEIKARLVVLRGGDDIVHAATVNIGASGPCAASDSPSPGGSRPGRAQAQRGRRAASLPLILCWPTTSCTSWRMGEELHP